MGMAVIGGLGIFMLGMKYMSEGMQAVAGGSLRRMISLVTDNRILATGTGTLVTMLVQSSSVTTVIVVGLVDAGLMQLHQAIGVILGANIGTTITGWILVLKIGKYGLPILGAAALVYVFTRRDRLRFVAMAVMGVGMVFFGLELMKDGFAPMADDPAFVDAFSWFQADDYLGVMKCVLLGCVLTFLVQSSSATLGITIGLASTGVIPFTTAAALVLGENIGTTITIVLASLGANTVARRTALAHVCFNVFGVFWITLVFPWYVRLVSSVIMRVEGADPMTATLAGSADPAAFAALMTAGIALTHSGFNITNSLAFLPFLKPYARLLERIIPEPEVKEVAQLRHLDARGVDAPVLGLEQSRGEVLQMAAGTRKMMDWIRQLAYSGVRDETLTQKVRHREEVLDKIQAEIVAFITELLDATVPQAVAREGQAQLRLAHEFEAMSDRLASILRGYDRLARKRLEATREQKEEFLALHDEMAGLLADQVDAMQERTTLPEAEIRERAGALKKRIHHLRDIHLDRMVRERMDPQVNLILTGILTDYRRVRAHILNVHEAAAGVDGTE